MDAGESKPSTDGEGPSPVEGDTRSDWHPADIQAALKKRGYTLAGISKANGYHPTAAGKALTRPWPALEALIANAVGVTPRQIWPSRYSVDPKDPYATPVRRRQRSAKP